MVRLSGQWLCFKQSPTDITKNLSTTGDFLVLPGFNKKDPAHTDYQYLEDIATAYWQSEVLFAALDLKLFQYIDQGASTLNSLAQAAQCNSNDLHRMLRALERMELVCRQNDHWFNSQISTLYLVPGRLCYMGNFFLYRRYMKPNWKNLAQHLSPNTTSHVGERRDKESGQQHHVNETEKGEGKHGPDHDMEYKQKNFAYVKSMDTLVRQKGEEISRYLRSEKFHGPILDVGGGAGSMIRAVGTLLPEMEALLFELPEVIEAARELYPEPDQWQGIETAAGDFRTHAFQKKFGLIILSNFLHAYAPDEARELLVKAISLLDRSAMMIIHDYFPDRRGRSPEKGALYDLAMMLNTYNGECHESGSIIEWLEQAGIDNHEVIDLATDSSVIVTGGSGTIASPTAQLINSALALGFENAVAISVDSVKTAPWVRKKCECGCAGFGKKLQCPPHGMSHHDTAEMLGCYEKAILVEGAPPGKQFHEMLLSLERDAFLKGYHKAFVFGAGPCPVCPACPRDGRCLHPDLSRPSMEGSGIDVYETARRAGIALTPVKQKGQYVKYMGLLLME